MPPSRTVSLPDNTPAPTPEDKMDDRSIRDLVQNSGGDADALNDLLRCYEAWGGRPAEDCDCAQFIGPVPRGDT
jgi:hypothetical protein